MSVGASLIPKIIRVAPILGTLEYMGPSPTTPLTFYGIPVISDPAFQVGTWMGIDRSVYPQFSSKWIHKPSGRDIHNHITDLIKLMDERRIK
jgi:hypothetical protein